jgi:hypothetical protein
MIVRLVIVVVFVVTTLTVIIGQLGPDGRNLVRGWDHYGLLPNWRLFAPRPQSFDYVLLRRDVMADDGRGAWREIRAPTRRRSWMGS